MSDPTRPKTKLVSEAIEVSAATSSKGPASTNIRVQVDTGKLSAEMGHPTETTRAFAVVPTVVDGERSWKEEELHGLGKQVMQDERVLESYDTTLQGPSDASDAGVTVFLETTEGTVSAQSPGSHQEVRQADQAAPSRPVKDKRKKK